MHRYERLGLTSLQALQKRTVERTIDRCGTSDLAEALTAELHDREKRLEHVIYVVLVKWTFIGETLQLLALQLSGRRRIPDIGVKQIEQHGV